MLISDQDDLARNDGSSLDGTEVIFTAVLNNGAKVRSWQTHTVIIAPGESVWVELT